LIEKEMEVDQQNINKEVQDNKKPRNKRGNDEASGSNPKKQAMKGDTTKTIMIEVP